MPMLPRPMTRRVGQAPAQPRASDHPGHVVGGIHGVPEVMVWIVTVELAYFPHERAQLRLVPDESARAFDAHERLDGVFDQFRLRPASQDVEVPVEGHRIPGARSGRFGERGQP